MIVIVATLWAQFAHAQAGAEAAPAVPALSSLAVGSPSSSFSELFRLSLEAEAGLAGRATAPAPFVPEQAQARVQRASAPLQGASVGASSPARHLEAAREGPSARLPRPDGWLMVLSWLAVIGFIAWRRSERAS